MNSGIETRPLLSMRGIHKRFPGVHALKGVDFEVRAGEVHALLGENGAGKSTLMHILAGIYQPDEGTISLGERQRLTIPDGRAAQQLGIGMVFQEGSLVKTICVAENIFFGRQPVNRWGLIRRDRLFAAAREILDELGLRIDPHLSLDALSPAEQQMVEIAKALSLNALLMIFDEPTSALSEAETAALFRVIRRLREKGVAIIYISHRLGEIFKIADRITVLKDGEWRGTLRAEETRPEELIPLMVGRELVYGKHGGTASAGAVALEVRHLSDRARVRDVSFVARAGEITAFAGLAGSGRTELALAISGASRRAAGEILVDGRAVSIRSPADALRAGIGYLGENRKEDGLFLEMGIADNIAAGRLSRFGCWWLREGELRETAADYCRRLALRAPSLQKPVEELSGGNQQKVMLSKGLLVEPRVLILDEPTRGIDVGAKAEIHALLRRLADQGTAVILISSELPEILAVADRILVLREGRLAGEISPAEATEERILHLASFAKEDPGRE